ncbi:MAG: hypothetical protein VXW65_03895 [Pseudomonadota bacterium]|nr:hypothetical protein [Pseudomonadota bacterium]
MSHMIIVTEIDDEEDEVTSLHMSGSEGMNALYRELGVPQFNQGTNGDGDAEIDRELVAAAGEALARQGHHAQAVFLIEVLEFSTSDSFRFSFS